MNRFFAWGPWLVLTALYAAHLVVIRSHAVDVPFWDEWAFLEPQALPHGLSWEWLWAQHNEHRIVPTKLLAWLLLKAGGWNQSSAITLNFLIYGTIVLLAARILIRAGLPGSAGACFLIPTLSALNYQNHSWGFQSQFHLCLLGLFLAVWGLLAAPTTDRRLALGVGVGGVLLAAFSFSSGVGASAVLLVLILLSGARARQATSLGAAGPAWLWAALVFGALVLVFWALGWERGSLSPHGPTHWRFWEVWLNLVALGFGFETPSAFRGGFCAALVLTPLVAWRVFREPSPRGLRGWLVLSGVVLGLLAALGLISLGRSTYGPHYALQQGGGRYAEFAVFLIPFTALGWYRVLAGRPRLRRVALVCLWSLAWLGHADNWSERPYREGVFGSESRRAAREQIRRYYETNDPSDLQPLPAVFHASREGPLQQVEAARVLGLSFTR